MTDIPAAQRPPSPAEIVRALAAMTPADLAERMAAAGAPPAPDHAAIVAAEPGLAGVHVRDIAIAGVHGDVPARRYLPPGPETSTADAALVWVHGGGFISGDLNMPESHWVGLSLAARGIPVLAVDYHKCIGGVHYPVPSDDVLDAWLWAVDHAADLGARPDRLHLGGASAGGALVAGVAKRLRDGAGRMPASLVLAYATVHPEVPPPSDALRRTLDDTPTSRGFFAQGGKNAMNLLYAGSEDALADPYAFAGNGDVSGQPPAYILNSDTDVLRASGEAYAAQLAAAGVPVRVEYEPGSAHGQLNQPFEDTGWRSLQRIEDWLRGQAR